MRVARRQIGNNPAVDSCARGDRDDARDHRVPRRRGRRRDAPDPARAGRADRGVRDGAQPRRLVRRGQSELFKIFIDEFGYGLYSAKHSTIFKGMLASVGLRTDLHAYWNFYLNSSLVGMNYFNYLTEDHRGDVPLHGRGDVPGVAVRAGLRQHRRHAARGLRRPGRHEVLRRARPHRHPPRPDDVREPVARAGARARRAGHPRAGPRDRGHQTAAAARRRGLPRPDPVGRHAGRAHQARRPLVTSARTTPRSGRSRPATRSPPGCTTPTGSSR